MVIADWNETFWYGSFNALRIKSSARYVQYPEKRTSSPVIQTFCSLKDATLVLSQQRFVHFK